MCERGECLRKTCELCVGQVQVDERGRQDVVEDVGDGGVGELKDCQLETSVQTDTLYRCQLGVVGQGEASQRRRELDVVKG